jgi:hypothetical protein
MKNRPQHPFRHIEIGNGTLAQGAHRHNVIGSSADKIDGFGAEGENLSTSRIDRND